MAPSWLVELTALHANEQIRTGSKIHAKMLDRLKKEVEGTSVNGAAA